MGVLTLLLLVCGQLLLFSLGAHSVTYPPRVSESPSQTTKTSPIKPGTITPASSTTGNYTENPVSNSTSNSNDTSTPYPTLSNTTNQGNTTDFHNTTLSPTQSNLNVTGTTAQSNTTQSAQTVQSTTPVTSSSQSTLEPKTSANITSTAVTAPHNITNNSSESTTSKQPVTTSPTVIPSKTTPFNESQGAGLNHSEKSLTILFSVLLGVIVLVIVVHFVYKCGRSKETRVQYTHRRLQNEDTGEFTVPDDTLVISGGLYDGPQIYNPTMTVQNEEEFQTDAPGFAYRPSQFRLEFLREDRERALDNEASTFQTFHTNEQEP